MDVKDQFEQALDQVNRGLRIEVEETKRFARYLLKRWRHEATTKEEQAEALEQLRDLIRLPSLLLLFALPGGAFIILGLERVLPFSLLPSAFRDAREEYHRPVEPKALPENTSFTCPNPSEPLASESKVGDSLHITDKGSHL